MTPPSHSPIYEVPQPDGSVAVLDLTAIAGYQDFGVYVTRAQKRKLLYLFHTQEIPLFCAVVERMLADDRRSPAEHAAAVRRELDRLATGLEPVEEAEHWPSPAHAQQILHPRPLAAQISAAADPRHIPESNLVASATADGMTLAIRRDDPEGITVLADIPTDRLAEVAAGIVWRTYAPPEDSFSPLSRTPTPLYLELLDLIPSARPPHA